MNTPLRLPAGSIRAILAIAIVSGTILLVAADRKPPNELWMAFSTVVTLYFAARQAEGTK